MNDCDKSAELDPTFQGRPPAYTPNDQMGMPQGAMPMSHHPPPPPPGQHPVTVAPGSYSVTVVNPSVVVAQSNIGSEPAQVVCPVCSLAVRTTVIERSTGLTHVAAGFLCFFCCIIAAFLPYCMGCFKQYEHYCPNCNAFIGRHVN